MNIVVFSHKEALNKGALLVDAISDSFGSDNLFHIINTNALKSYLKQGRDQKDLLILLAETPARLEELICYCDLLEDKRIILVVPDNEPATLSRAQQLFPRFFTPVSEDYGDLCSVARKMARVTPGF